MILSIRERRGRITLRSICREEQSKISHSRWSSIEHDEKTDDRSERLNVEDRPAKTLFIGNPRRSETGDDGEDVGWRGEELGFDVGESETFAQDDGGEEGEGVAAAGDDEVVDAVEENFDVEE